MCLTDTLRTTGDRAAARRRARSLAACVVGLGVWLSGATAAWAQAEMSAYAEPRVTNVGGVVEYTVSLDAVPGQDVRVLSDPSFGSMRNMGSSRGTEFNSGPQGTQLRYTFTFELRATAEGVVEIVAPKAQVGDKTVQARPVKVKVLPRGEKPKGEPTARGPVFVEPIFSTKTPYVGQQVLVEYALFVDGRQVGPFGVEVQDLKVPDFDGFWTEELNQRAHVESQRRKVIDGKRYTVRPLQLMSVFPLEEGEVTVAPMEVQATVSARRTLRRRKLPIQAPEVKLQVRPLPSGAPRGFPKGNVGLYEFDVTVDKRRVAVGEPFGVRLRVRGEGLIGRVELPTFPESEAYRQLEPVESKKSGVNGRTVVGEKVAEVVLTPTREGTLTVPALTLHTFNPFEEAYVTLRSRPIQVQVRGQAAPPPDAEVKLIEREGAVPEAVRVSRQSLAPLRGLGVVQPVAFHGAVLGDPMLWGALLGPPLLFALWLLLGVVRARQSQDSPSRRRREALKASEALLAEASERLKGGEPGRAAEAAMEALTGVLATGLEVPPGSLSSSRVARLLQERQVPTSLIESVQDVRARTEQARFGGDAQQLDGLVDELKGLIKELSRALS